MSIERVRKRIKSLKAYGVGGIPYKDLSIENKQDTIRATLVCMDYQLSHSAYSWNAKEHVCGCKSQKGDLEYRPFGFIHFLPRSMQCIVGNMCWCLNLRTMELRRHIIGNCPDGQYGWSSSTSSILLVTW